MGTWIFSTSYRFTTGIFYGVSGCLTILDLHDTTQLWLARLFPFPFLSESLLALSSWLKNFFYVLIVSNQLYFLCCLGAGTVQSRFQDCTHWRRFCLGCVSQGEFFVCFVVSTIKIDTNFLFCVFFALFSVKGQRRISHVILSILLESSFSSIITHMCQIRYENNTYAVRSKAYAMHLSWHKTDDHILIWVLLYVLILANTS
jgi:hypothetical protein